jgi:hypothetical protein
MIVDDYIDKFVVAVDTVLDIACWMSGDSSQSLKPTIMRCGQFIRPKKTEYSWGGPAAAQCACAHSRPQGYRHGRRPYPSFQSEVFLCCDAAHRR